jgi:hypothetical protein
VCTSSAPLGTGSLFGWLDLYKVTLYIEYPERTFVLKVTDSYYNITKIKLC